MRVLVVGFSDGADLFVFVSGYTATLVFGKMMAQRGFLIGATRLFKRVWQLYVAHVLLFLFYLTSVHYLAHRLDISHLMDQFNVARLMEFPVETLADGLLLKFKPLNLDVLPLYLVLMGSGCRDRAQCSNRAQCPLSTRVLTGMDMLPVPATQ